MKRFDPRIVFGFLLIVGGALALAQTMGLLTNVSDIFWGGLFLAAGLIFLSLLFGGHWWAAFPGFTLAALGVLILLSDSLGDFGGAIFLGGVGLSFWYVYFTSRIERWWALIPAGVLTALAVMIVVTQQYEDFGAAIFLGGIGLSFFAVYFTERNERWWALIPGGVLVTLAGVTVAATRIWRISNSRLFLLWPCPHIPARGIADWHEVGILAGTGVGHHGLPGNCIALEFRKLPLGYRFDRGWRILAY